MRYMEDACQGCGAMGGTCRHCESEVIECDGCGSIIEKAYAFPDDSSDEDYCRECIINRLADESELTDNDECPECEAEADGVYKWNDSFYCSNCLEDFLETLEKED